MQKSWHDHLIQSWKPLIASLTLCGIIGSIYFTMGRAHIISQNELIDMKFASLSGYTGATFGDRFTLRGLDIKCKSDGLHIKLAWESASEQKLNLTNSIHLTDGTGTIVAQSSYKESRQSQSVEAGDVWMVTQFISAKKLNNSIKNIAILLFEDQQHLLPINQGTRDWRGKRLIIPFENCSAG